MMTNEVLFFDLLNSVIKFSDFCVDNFDLSASLFASWIIGPSAIGSEKGTPISMASATREMEARCPVKSALVGQPAVR